jgi:hypothetical protein
MARTSTARTALSPAHKLFVNSYLTNGFNAARAYLKIKPKATYQTACVEGSRLLRNPKVAAYVSSQLDQYGMSAAEALARLAAQARASADDVLSDNGTIDLERACATGAIAAIKKLSTRETITPEGNTVQHTNLEMYSSQDALEKILRAHGAFKDRVDLTSNDQSLEQVVVYLPANNR